MRIYLAGLLFTVAERRFNQMLADQLGGGGMRCFFCSVTARRMTWHPATRVGFFLRMLRLKPLSYALRNAIVRSQAQTIRGAWVVAPPDTPRT